MKSENAKGQEQQGPVGQKAQDFHEDWLKVIRAAQAACKDNGGFGVLTIIVSVNQNTPVFWNPVMRHKLHPARAAQVQMTPQMAASLMAVMDMYVDEPVVVPE